MSSILRTCRAYKMADKQPLSFCFITLHNDLYRSIVSMLLVSIHNYIHILKIYTHDDTSVITSKSHCLDGGHGNFKSNLGLA